MKKFMGLTLAFVLALSAVPAIAANHTGTVTLVHYNTTVPGRGVCVRTSPDGPGTGWFCLWDTYLYKEITDILRDAYINARTCTLNWDVGDPHGHNLLNLVQCQ
jgi:putative cell wall-binding protein